MRVLLISPNREEISMRTLPLGLACVAAAVSRSGHEVELLDLMQEEDPRGLAGRPASLVYLNRRGSRAPSVKPVLSGFIQPRPSFHPPHRFFSV